MDCVDSLLKLVETHVTPWARFSKIQKSFRTRKAVAKSQNLRLQSCFLHRSSLHRRSFRRIQLSAFKYRLTKSSFEGSIRFNLGFSRNGLLVSTSGASTSTSAIIQTFRHFGNLFRRDWVDPVFSLAKPNHV